VKHVKVGRFMQDIKFDWRLAKGPKHEFVETYDPKKIKKRKSRYTAHTRHTNTHNTHTQHTHTHTYNAQTHPSTVFSRSQRWSIR
jgi:hypothetical protein